MKAEVLSGLDRLELYHPLLNGQRIGLMTNQTGIDSGFRHCVDILNQNYKLTALLAAEHGIWGDVQAGEKVLSFKDKRTGINVYSLYGDKTEPDDDIMSLFDMAVFDMQDVGARFYTYLYSLSNLMKACAKSKTPLIVMDRQNIISGDKVEGTIIEKELSSFVGGFALPTRHALTIGEYALYVRKHLKLDIDLTVIPLKGWKREYYQDDTQSPFVAPSPNLPGIQSAICYIGTCIFEGTNISEGRGTTLPFQVIGAPFIDGFELALKLKKLDLQGVYFRPVSFSPSFSKHKDSPCSGVQMHITDRKNADVFLSGLMLLETIWQMYEKDFCFIEPKEGALAHFDRLLGTKDFRLGKINAKELYIREKEKLLDFVKETKTIRLYE